MRPSGAKHPGPSRFYFFEIHTRLSHKTGFFYFIATLTPLLALRTRLHPTRLTRGGTTRPGGGGVPRRLQPGECQTGFVHHRPGHGKVLNPVARVLGHATVRLVGVTAVRLEAPAVGVGEGADAPGHAVGLVLGEALLDSRDDIFPGGHGLDAHVAVQRVEEGKVEVVKVGALGGLGDHDDVEAVLDTPAPESSGTSSSESSGVESGSEGELGGLGGSKKKKPVL